MQKTKIKEKMMTAEQKLAVETLDRPIIISASAGSGKTSTMVERLISILDKNLCDVSEILALTFTRSASTEMKQRLAMELQKLLEREGQDKKRIEKFIAELNVADITSLDSFCQKVIKKYFYVIDIDPNFNVIDEVEAGYLKASALESTFVAEGDTLEFRELTQALSDTKRLDNVSKLIYKFSEFLFTLVDYRAFIRQALDEKKVLQNVLDYMLNRFREMFVPYKQEFTRVYQIVTSKKYEALQDNCELAYKFVNLFNKFTLQEMQNLRYMPTFTRFSDAKKGREAEELELQKEIKPLFSSFEDDMQEYIKAFCFGNLDAMRAHYKNSCKSVEYLCKLTLAYIDRYNALKSDRNVLDFTDLEDKAIEILKNEQVQQDIKGAYKFICVDEFQDTNEKQSALLEALDGGANNFFVGDPKQSIYNFRQCDLNIFVRLIEKYKLDSSKLALSFNQNFRSHKRILEFVNLVFDRVMLKSVANIDYAGENRFEKLKTLRFKLKGKIKSGRKVGAIDRVKILMIGKKEKGVVLENGIIKSKFRVIKSQNIKFTMQKGLNVYSVLNDHGRRIDFIEVDEGQVAVNYIAEFFAKKIMIRDPITKQKRRVRYSDFVVLLRSRTNFRMYIDAFNKNSIPVSARFKFNLVSLAHIMMLINLLKCVSNPKDDLPLSTALKLIGKLSDLELFTIRNQHKEGNFYSAVAEFEPKTDEEQLIAQKLEAFEGKLQEYIIYARNFSVSSLLMHILRQNDLYNYFWAMQDGADKVEQINLFISKLENKSFDENLDEFLQFLQNYKDAFEVDYSTIADDNSVQITTIHNSKGLEYPIVIVGGCGTSFNLSSSSNFVYSKELGVGSLDVDLAERVEYPTISNCAIYKQNRIQEILEEMRILYVALTRAKEYLALIGTEQTNKVGELNESNILKCKTFFDFILNGSEYVL